MAKVCGKALPISTKKTIVVCDFIRHKNLQKAKELLSNVVKKKVAVPFTRFNKDMGHKKGMGAGRFPVKTSKEMILLLESAEANAQFKGLNTSNLVISYIKADGASRPWHQGRQRRRKMKRCNVEIIVSEKEPTKKEKKAEEPKKEKVKEEKSLEKKSQVKLSNKSEKDVEKAKLSQKEVNVKK